MRSRKPILQRDLQCALKLQTSVELKNEVDSLAKTHEELQLQLQDRKEQIPYLQFINQLKSKGIDIDKMTVAQRLQLREIEADLLQNEKDRLQMQSKATIDSLKDQNEQTKIGSKSARKTPRF